MDMRRLLRIVLPLMAAVAAGIGWLMMDKPHRDVGGEAARHKMVPEELQLILAEGGETAAPYLDAVVELYGVVLEDNGRRVMLEGGVVASWDTTRDHRHLEKGSSSNSRAGSPVMMTCLMRSAWMASFCPIHNHEALSVPHPLRRVVRRGPGHRAADDGPLHV